MTNTLFDAEEPQRLESSSEHLLSALNDPQRQAVTHRASPLAVIAGPGTGKTRVITHRIAGLILDDNRPPEQIVALTFTNKSAEEMRSRLAALVGPSTADRVFAGTFHSFAYRLLDRFGDLAGFKRHQTQSDIALEIRTMRAIVNDEIEQGRIPPELLVQGTENIVQTALSWKTTLANDGFQPDELSPLAQRWHELAESADEEQREQERIHARDFAIHAHLAQRLSAKMRELGVRNHDDALLLPVALMEKSETARQLIRSEYKHFVVDEFQDVNHAQLRFLEAIAPPSSSPDLCVVGDDDQAIYGFRNATDLAFQNFQNTWTDARLVALTENHRSSPTILKAVNEIVSHANARAVPDKTISAQRSFSPPAPDSIELIETGNYTHIGSTIAAMIKTEIARNPSLELGSIGVIATSNTDIARYADALELAGIPAQRRIRDATKDQAIQDLLNWAGLIANPTDKILVRRLLSRPPFRVQAQQLGTWLREHRAAEHRHTVLATQSDESFLDSLRAHADADSALQAFLATFESLRDACQSLRPGEALRKIAADTGLMVADLPTPSIYTLRLKTLARMITFADNKERFFDPPRDLGAMLDYFVDLGDSAFDTDDEQDEQERENAVQLITAHSSKGLEFDTVFAARMGSGGFGVTRSRSTNELPDALKPGIEDQRSVKERADDEQRRLFYVAITRAERRLVLVTPLVRNPLKTKYAGELLASSDVPVVQKGRNEVLEQAAEAGALIIPDREHEAFSQIQARHDTHQRIVNEARARIADILHVTSTTAQSAESIEQFVQRIADHARKIAVSRALCDSTAPAELASKSIIQPIEDLYAALKPDKPIDPERPVPLTPQSPPLKLSYSQISLYSRCPLCYYAKYVAGLDDAPTLQRALGIIAHDALERYYRNWREADANGQPTPGVEALIALAKTSFEEFAVDDQELTPDRWASIRAMLEIAHANLHDERAHIELLEHKHTFSYAHDGVEHSIEARIDRLDRLPSGGIRLIDYKTGNASKAMLEPKGTDLQLGLYILAAESMFESPLTGSAEYWVVRQGVRGVLDIAALDRNHIQTTINKTIDGLLAGEFPIGKNCQGICEPLRNRNSAPPAP